MNGAAAREPVANVVELDLADWEHAMRVNLTGIFLMCKYAIPKIAAAGGGSVINVASQLGSVVVPNRPAYVTSKAATIQLSKSMALDFAKDNVRVNSLSPGATETGRLLAHYQTMEAVRRALVPLHPIGRLGQPEDLRRRGALPRQRRIGLRHRPRPDRRRRLHGGLTVPSSSSSRMRQMRSMCCSFSVRS